jgi:5-hydroxyisourate hydrolase-like protein (transthyretin family)
MNVFHSFGLLMLIALTGGCSSTPPEVPPGTEGLIHAEGSPLADVHVQVYAQESSSLGPLGSALSDADGRFQLRLPDLSGPLHLEPGDYRFTIESAGDIYLNWPAALSDPQKTPLRKTITDPQQVIELDVPTPR